MQEQIKIPSGKAVLEGDLTVPPEAAGIVVFVHGSGSGRHGPRNRRVAKVFQDTGLATLLMDLLTTEEEKADIQTAHLRFDIGLLARRLEDATDWLVKIVIRGC